MIQATMARVLDGHDLTRDEARDAMNEIMAGDASEVQIAVRGKEALVVWSDARGAAEQGHGDTLTIDSPNHGRQVVAINNETKVLTPKGIFRHNNMEVTSLVPGLEVEVKGTGDTNGQIVAERIEFTKESLRAANQVHAAMTVRREVVRAYERVAVLVVRVRGEILAIG